MQSLGMRLCPLDLAHQIFWNIVAIRDSHALLHTENNALALFKQTGDYGSVVLPDSRPTRQRWYSISYRRNPSTKPG